MFDDHAKKAREVVDVPWDEVRAARVHKRALEAFRSAEEEALAAEAERELAAEIDPGPAIEPSSEEPGEAPSVTDEADQEGLAIPLERRRSGWLLAVVAAAAMLVLWLATRDSLTEGRGAEEHAMAMAWRAASTLQYTDGSRSLLAEEADVQVVHDDARRIEVQQATGRVRYEITKRPKRRFVVEARDVTVTVLGTVFEVQVAGDEVAISVQRGRVRVEHGSTEVELTEGQRLELFAPESPKPAAAGDELDRGESEGSEMETPPPETQDEAIPGTGGAAAEPSAAELMRAADDARGAGRLEEAARHLRRLVRLHPRDGRVTLAMFTLGRVERARGNHEAAAQAFERCGDALRGDAIAEAASSWHSAGQSDRARQAAQRYLAAHPDGVHAEPMKKLAGAR